MPTDIDLADFDYPLPPERIAQHPPAARDSARLLVLDRASGALHHSSIRALPRWLEPGDLLVRNATRVVPARLRGRKSSGGVAQALLLGDAGAPGQHRALVRAAGRLRPGLKFEFEGHARRLEAEIVDVTPDGEVVLSFGAGDDPYSLGETPLPPYIRRDAPEARDAERYQTLFARVPGSVAAPTAGLHFSHELLAELERAGVGHAEVVLHVGPGTFRPLREADLARGHLHSEPFELPEASSAAIAAARRSGRRVVAVGTTTTRVLESCADATGAVTARRGTTELFLRPGSRIRVVDALLTNFHLPRSSLLLLVAAFTGREALLAAYAEAIREEYRFFSYGDAMLIL
ncbi:MAG: tRNA preQ1(34) S-adenosylmethionine ribosyltransferase-isomerase QueA [Deltaproteobacteria bacterium]|nr:tRNA preQ1(34) S-adenosylmethionine ribosyltransferase-isomerase QueA [Deltaproteobacteria bacterium]MBW2362198.1 tRNA preQ1(34) S-adenosylmethionine ribosyltransferase-isomerase QueA [Deltaproteobacteria bacterium]